MKQKKLNFKPDRNKRGRPHKQKANNSGGRDWKSKFRKAIKTNQGLKSIVSIMATEERTNQAIFLVLASSNSQPSVPGNQVLVSAISACSVQTYSTALVVRPPTPNVVATTGVASNRPAQATISTVSQAYPATKMSNSRLFSRNEMSPPSTMRGVVWCQA